jgi:HAD superfamily hydrolase (TIGR01509 family)
MQARLVAGNDCAHAKIQPMQHPALLFDLDGTLIDSVYQHVLAWREALLGAGIELPVWKIHRKIGISGGLFINALFREIGKEIDADTTSKIQALHHEAYSKMADCVVPLPGAKELLSLLTKIEVPWAIATSSHRKSCAPLLEKLAVPDTVPVITRDMVAHAKPDPDLFLAAAAALGADIQNSVVVGDSIWDLLAARRARALGVGVLSGGYGQSELEAAGAYRVYADPADLLAHLDEIGIRAAS